MQHNQIATDQADNADGSDTCTPRAAGNFPPGSPHTLFVFLKFADLWERFVFCGVFDGVR